MMKDLPTSTRTPKDVQSFELHIATAPATDKDMPIPATTETPETVIEKPISRDARETSETPIPEINTLHIHSPSDSDSVSSESETSESDNIQGFYVVKLKKDRQGKAKGPGHHRSDKGKSKPHKHHRSRRHEWGPGPHGPHGLFGPHGPHGDPRHAHAHGPHGPQGRDRHAFFGFGRGMRGGFGHTAHCRGRGGFLPGFHPPMFGFGRGMPSPFGHEHGPNAPHQGPHDDHNDAPHGHPLFEATEMHPPPPPPPHAEFEGETDSDSYSESDEPTGGPRGYPHDYMGWEGMGDPSMMSHMFGSRGRGGFGGRGGPPGFDGRDARCGWGSFGGRGGFGGFGGRGGHGHGRGGHGGPPRFGSSFFGGPGGHQGPPPPPPGFDNDPRFDFESFGPRGHHQSDRHHAEHHNRARGPRRGPPPFGAGEAGPSGPFEDLPPHFAFNFDFGELPQGPRHRHHHRHGHHHGRHESRRAETPVAPV